jgi:hypothetical protein
MKKQALILSALILTVSFFQGCSQNDKTPQNSTEHAKEEYQCPMKCTEEKFGQPGQCPVCGMDLEKVASG